MSTMQKAGHYRRSGNARNSNAAGYDVNRWEQGGKLVWNTEL